MKGVSTVIATILMLMITIGLAGMAYMYISGIFTTKTQGIEIADNYCTAGTVTLKIRNIGTTAISANSITVTRTAPTGTPSSTTCCSAAVDPGRTGDYTDTTCGTGGKSCVYRLTPPVGMSVEATQYCT